MNVEQVEVSVVRGGIANVLQAREAHIPVANQRELSVQELNGVMECRAGAQTRLTEREREIALTGAPLPAEPFAEEGEIARLNRHIRILQERVRVCERKERESQGRIDATIRELEEAWIALGAATSDRLLQQFRQAASLLRDAQQAYWALGPYFARVGDAAVWKGFDRNLTIVDPVSRDLVWNPLFMQFPGKWTPVAQALRESTDALRAEIDAVAGRAGIVAAPAAQEDGTED